MSIRPEQGSVNPDRSFFARIYFLLRLRATLFAAVFILPLIFLLVYDSIKLQTAQWSLRVDSPAMLGLPAVYRVEGQRVIQLIPTEIVSTESGGFRTRYEGPGLDGADLRILIREEASAPRMAPVSAQFVSEDGSTIVELPPVLIPTCPVEEFDLESKKGTLPIGDLPRLSSSPVILPPPTTRTVVLYLLLTLGCVAVGVLYFISAMKGMGAEWLSRISKSSPGSRLQGLVGRNLLLFLLIFNLGAFVLTALLFAQRYPVSDDPMMAMIANGILGTHPSEYVVFINVILGFVLKTFAILLPSAPSYAIFTALVLIVSSSVIGWSLIRKLGLGFGGVTYIIAFFFFIFYVFFHLEFTTTAALSCLAGLSLVLTSESSSKHIFLAAILLMWLGSMIRYEAAQLVIVLSLVPVTIHALQKRRFSLLVFYAACIAGMMTFRAIDHAYYDATPEWKSFRAYNGARGGLHTTTKFKDFDDNRDVYEKIGWNENDLRMMTKNWLYQDPEVFSKEKLDYLNQHLLPPKDPNARLFYFIIPLYTHSWMTVAVLAFLLHQWLSGRLRFLLAASIGIILFGMFYYLSWAAHLPEHVFIPGMLEAFLLASLLSDARLDIGFNHFWLAVVISLGLLLGFCEFQFVVKSSEHDARRTVELNKALDKIGFLNQKVIQVSITSLRYEDLPPFGNDNRLRSFKLLDGLWLYPSPDVVGAYRKYGITHPLADLAENDDFYILIPTFDRERCDEIQKFLLEHDHLKTSYEVIKDPDGNICCYPNFSVVKFHREAGQTP